MVSADDEMFTSPQNMSEVQGAPFHRNKLSTRESKIDLAQIIFFPEYWSCDDVPQDSFPSDPAPSRVQRCRLTKWWFWPPSRTPDQ